MTELLVENIIATTHLHQHIDLPTIAASIPDSTFDTKEQPVLIVHFKNPKRALCILPDGLLFCTGITSLDEAYEMLTQFFSMLEQKGIEFDIVPQLSISITTVSTTIEQPIQLSLVKKALQNETVFYDPDKAPWLEYHFSNEITIIIFPSGKLILTGSSVLSDMKAAFHSLKDKLLLKGVL
jgi:TATA-box binding protein (TBP) (component of TFIID and TFIIIB)